jgi:DNA polymerase I
MSARRAVAFDFETTLIAPANMAPKPVCMTWQFEGEAAPSIVHRTDCERLLKAWLEDDSILFVGHNVAFDMAVVLEAWPHLNKLIFAAYEAGRVVDTMIRSWLIDNACGIYRGQVKDNGYRFVITYDLEREAKRRANIVLKKDHLRLSYGKFLHVPLEQWPARMVEIQREASLELITAKARIFTKHEAKEKKANDKLIADLQAMVDGDASRCTTYALDDARATLAVYQAQEKHAHFLKDQYRQTFAYFALYLSACWGIRTNPEAIEELWKRVQEKFEEMDEELQLAGLVKPDGVRDTKAAKARMIRICRDGAMSVVRTEAHFKDDAPCGGRDDCEEHVCLDGDACERSEDLLLMHYAERTTLAKQLANDIPAMKTGAYWPLHTRYGFAATGRTTSSKPGHVPGTNIQNISKHFGFREVYIPRPGRIFIDVDYPTLEAFCLAQCCMSWLGFSKMAEALNAGLDIHTWVAAKILKSTYEECVANASDPEVKQARKLAKPLNFGLPGGMGVPTFLTATRKAMGRKAYEELFPPGEEGIKKAKELKKVWFEAWPEMPEYFARANELCGQGGRASVETLFTGRTRGNATYCATNNNGFQALGSDCAKRAACLLATAQYADEKSPLWNTRTVAFVHDQFLIEALDNELAHDAAVECARLMAVGANEFLPDVPIPFERIKPAMSRVWSKDAVGVLDARGRLVPWTAALKAAA